MDGLGCMAPAKCIISEMVSNRQTSKARSGIAADGILPMEHDPLCCGGDALMRLVQRRELRENCIIGVGHGECTRSATTSATSATSEKEELGQMGMRKPPQGCMVVGWMGCCWCCYDGWNCLCCRSLLFPIRSFRINYDARWAVAMMTMACTL